jgi:hypothetical protein
MCLSGAVVRARPRIFQLAGAVGLRAARLTRMFYVLFVPSGNFTNAWVSVAKFLDKYLSTRKNAVGVRVKKGGKWKYQP